MVAPIQSFEEFQQLINGDKVVVIDFYADWCGPCKAFAPTFESFANNLNDNPNIDFYKVNIDDQTAIAEELQIRSIPTFMLFRNGAKVGEAVGANKAKLELEIKRNTF